MLLLGLVVVWPNGTEAIFTEGQAGQFALEPVVEGVESPTDVGTAGDGSDRLFVVEREGRVVVIDPTGIRSETPLLDLSDEVVTTGEGGMLAIAFHPDFASDVDVEGSGRFYVSWTNPEADLIVAEFTLLQDSDVAEPGHRVILEIPQPSHDHNGGDLAFGPDGYLYVSVGDGAMAGQQGLQAQNLELLLGKILRIDIDHDGGVERPYTIPADNPFVNHPDARPEIFALGLRNPWRIAFHNGELWAGDVGGAAAEEINLIEAGGNYGWPIYEGNSFKFLAAGRHVLQGRIFEYLPALFRMNLSDDHRRIPPVAAYPHENSAAVTGGLVVKESAGLPGITGRYLFSDFVRGTIWSLDPSREPAIVTTLVTEAGPIVSFGESANGEVLVVSLGGTIFKLVENA